VPDIATAPVSVDFGNIFVGFDLHHHDPEHGTDVFNVTDIGRPRPRWIRRLQHPPLGSASSS
jgi:hypothetical protein